MALGQIEELLENQKELMRRMADIALDKRLQQEWYTAADCARLKGISHAVLTGNAWMRPLGGTGWKWIARRRRWHRSAALEWLAQDDLTLLELYGSRVDKEHYKAGVSQPTAS
jgi:hypothetical protein